MQEVSLYGRKPDTETKRSRGQDSRHQKDPSHGRVLADAAGGFVEYAYLVPSADIPC